MILEVYKILRDIDRINSLNLFPWAMASGTRGHRFKVRSDEIYVLSWDMMNILDLLSKEADAITV